MNFERTDYYEILGVTHNASFENITRAKDRAIYGTNIHPEDSVDHIGYQKSPITDVLEAYDVLSDPGRRAQYDRYLAEMGIKADNARTRAEFYTARGIEESVPTDDFEINIPVEEEKSSAKEAAEKAEKEKAEKEAAEKAEKEKAEKEAAEKAEKEKAEKEAAEKAEKEKAEKEAAEKAEKEKAEKEAAEKAKKEKETETSTYDLKYAIPFTQVNERYKEMSHEYRAKTIGKHVLGSIVALPLGGPLGIIGFNVWMTKRRGKIKVQKDKVPKKMTEVKAAEAEAFKEYEENLNKEIDNLLSEPHNNYRLEICKKKYEAKIKLLEKQLEIRSNTNIKGIVQKAFNKVQVVAVVNELDNAKKRLEQFEDAIERYDKKKTPRLAKLNEKLIKTTEELSKQPEARVASQKVRNLKVRQNAVLQKRNEKGTAVKKRIVRNGNIYDGIVKVVGKVASVPYLFAKSDFVDKKVYGKETVEEEKSKSK